MSKAKFPWGQLSADDRRECERDLFVFGNCFARVKHDGRGYERVSPADVATDERVVHATAHNFKHWWQS